MTKSGPSPFECFSFLFEGISLEGVVWSVCCCRHEGNEEGHEEGNSICSTNEEVRSCLSIAGRPIRDDGNGAVAEPSSNLTRACRMLDLVVSQASLVATDFLFAAKMETGEGSRSCVCVQSCLGVQKRNNVS